MVKQVPSRDEISFVKDVIRCIIKLEFWEVFQQQFSIFHWHFAAVWRKPVPPVCTLHCECKLQC